jgi:DNA polymerase elongation subunit (family B)
MGDLILELFEERKKEKDLLKKYKEGEQGYCEHNNNQSAIKLMLNSVYGKTIIKSSFTKNVIKPNSDVPEGEFLNNTCMNYLFKNYENVHEYYSLGNDKAVFKTYDIDKSFNFAHVGISVLSYSKRMMNEVLDICNDEDFPVYYMDTDSLHLKQKNVPKLAKIYKKKYNRELIGKNLGQMHEDFDFDNHDDLISNYSVFYDKKVYLDIITGKNRDTGKIEQKVHVRMKGVNICGLANTVKEFDETDSIKGHKKLFEKLIENSEHNAKVNARINKLKQSGGNVSRKIAEEKESIRKVSFVLNPVQKPSFEFKNFDVTTRNVGEFIRRI